MLHRRSLRLVCFQCQRGCLTVGLRAGRGQQKSACTDLACLTWRLLELLTPINTTNILFMYLGAIFVWPSSDLQHLCGHVWSALACFSNVLGSLSASSSDLTSHFMRLRRKWPRDIVAAYHWKDGRISVCVFQGFPLQVYDIPSKEQTLEPIKSFPLDKLIQTECPIQGWNTWNLRFLCASIAEQWEL